MSLDENKDYEAILVDTSIFDEYGLKLDKGLLGALKQFKDSEIEYLFPDVIKGEVQSHLNTKIKDSRSALSKALKSDYLFFDDSESKDANLVLSNISKNESIAEKTIDSFIFNTGALVLECGDYISVSELLNHYFQSAPPFTDVGKKKSEFPDAIVLLATEAWAKDYSLSVLAVSKDNDWKNYCEKSTYIDCTDDFSNALSQFNKHTVPFKFLSTLISKIEDNDKMTIDFIDEIRREVDNYLGNYSPEQEANSYYYWEPDGCNGTLKDFELNISSFKVVDYEKNYLVLEVQANIIAEFEGYFSLSQYDSIDREYIHLDNILVLSEEDFTSEILVTICGDLEDEFSNLDINHVEIINSIDIIDFGTLELSYK